jgi:hypothetical protein
MKYNKELLILLTRLKNEKRDKEVEILWEFCEILEKELKETEMLKLTKYIDKKEKNNNTDDCCCH